MNIYKILKLFFCSFLVKDFLIFWYLHFEVFSHPCFVSDLLRCHRSYNHSGYSCRCLWRSTFRGHDRMWYVNAFGVLTCCFVGSFCQAWWLVLAICHRIIVLNSTVVRFWSRLEHLVIYVGREKIFCRQNRSACDKHNVDLMKTYFNHIALIRILMGN